MWWNYEIKSAVKRKEAAWKKVLPASDVEAKEICMETYRKEEKRCIYQSKKKVNEHFGMKMNGDVNGNKRLFWKEVSSAKGGKV